jgi:hypothetical protein
MLVGIADWFRKENFFVQTMQNLTHPKKLCGFILILFTFPVWVIKDSQLIVWWKVINSAALFSYYNTV